VNIAMQNFGEEILLKIALGMLEKNAKYLLNDENCAKEKD
jgi:hypothetical protein